MCFAGDKRADDARVCGACSACGMLANGMAFATGADQTPPLGTCKEPDKEAAGPCARSDGGGKGQLASLVTRRYCPEAAVNARADAMLTICSVASAGVAERVNDPPQGVVIEA